MAKPRYFVIVSHCLLNPATRVHVLGRRFTLAVKVCDYLLTKNIGVIQLPCPEFTAMGYWRNPQGRQQYNNVFFKKHCYKELESYVDMISELVNNSNTLLCYIGIQGSPTCSIHWGKHKLNRYKTESMEEAPQVQKAKAYVDGNLEGDDIEESYDPSLAEDTLKSDYGVMTLVLDEMLKEKGIHIPYLEAPVKESLQSQRCVDFFNALDDLLGIPEAYRPDYTK